MDFTLEEIKELNHLESITRESLRTILEHKVDYTKLPDLLPNTWYIVQARTTNLAYWDGKDFSFTCSGWPGEDYFTSLDSHWDSGGTIKPYSIVELSEKFYKEN